MASTCFKALLLVYAVVSLEAFGKEKLQAFVQGSAVVYRLSLHLRTHITLNANLGISVERYTMCRLVCSIAFVETHFSVGEFLVVDTLQITTFDIIPHCTSSAHVRCKPFV